MKPLYLELQAFGPYVNKQSVNFEELEKKGAFLIKGPTGSGKTTIFDAMTFALYGGGSGEDEKIRIGRNDLNEWRCNQAGPDLDTYVQFVFSVNGKKYMFKRSLIQKRKNLWPEFYACEILEDGNEISLFDNPKADMLKAKAEELIGLTKNQFRQVVLLPQGQFEQFLTASSEQKEKILETIFDAKEWELYAQRVFDIACKRKNELNEKKKKFENSLEEEKISSLEELTEKIDDLEEEMKTLEENHAAFGGNEKQKKLEYEKVLFQRFEDLENIRHKIEVLQSRQAKIDEKHRKLEIADKAEALREYIQKYDRTLNNRSRRETEYKNILDNIPAAEIKVKKAQLEKEALAAGSPIETNQKKIGKYEAKKPAYEMISSLKKELDMKKAELSDAEKDLEQAEKVLKKAKTAAEEAYICSEKAGETAKDHSRRYYEGIYGQIASELVEGNKCPVCGSTHHPEKAPKGIDSVSKAQVDEKEALYETAKRAWKKADETREKAEGDHNSKKEEKLLKENAWIESKTKYDNSSKDMIPGISSLAELNAEIKNLEKENNDFENRLKQLGDVLEAKKNELVKLNTELQKAEKEKDSAIIELEDVKKHLDGQLIEKGFHDLDEVRKNLMTLEDRTAVHEEIVNYETSLTRYKTDFKTMTDELAGVNKPEESTFEERLKEIKQEEKHYLQTRPILSKERERLNNKFVRLEKMSEEYKAEIYEAESDLAFAKKLRGDSSVGIKRYVLAIMFNKVIAEANQMLKKVHGGRYHLYGSSAKGNGNKRGLELCVTDNRVPDKEGRSVRMLSGGEKFLVSLSLSIGMSTVAQKSGVHIEALFIDEGFGTLDDGSINDAIEILESVRQGNGMIGIISHVPLLESCIATHVEVIRSESGNRIVVN